MPRIPFQKPKKVEWEILSDRYGRAWLRDCDAARWVEQQSGQEQAGRVER